MTENAQSADGVDRGSVSMAAFNDLLTFEGEHATPTTHAPIIRDDNELEVALPRLVERHMRYNVLLTSGRLIAQHYNIPVKHQQRIIEIVENHAE